MNAISSTAMRRDGSLGAIISMCICEACLMVVPDDVHGWDNLPCEDKGVERANNLGVRHCSRINIRSCCG